MWSKAEADLRACAATLRQGSRSFAWASLLLPAQARGAAQALYGFCRVADDLIDEVTAEARPEAIVQLRARLARACAGRPDEDPIDRAFAATLQERAIPACWPEALLEGFAWDAAQRRYADLPALRAYAARVAGAVGAMMALALGATGPDALARACDLGVAMQLTNIARDVGDDARAGRLYLPLDWLAEAGIDPDAFLARPRFSPALGGVVARLLAEAERLYARAEAGIAALPPRCRPAIRAALALYREIGRKLEAEGCDSVARRCVVNTRRKARVMLAAQWRRRGAALADGAAPADVTALAESQALAKGTGPALPETAFLLAALPCRPVEADKLSGAVRVLELFALLEQRERRGSIGWS